MKIIKDNTWLMAVAFCAFVAAQGCSSRANNTHTIPEKHQASVHSRGSGMIYIDKIDCKRVMQQKGGEPVVFHCYLVGFIDSLGTVKPKNKKDEAAGKYFEYDMQNDWVALSATDTLRPVFFESRFQRESHRREGILVFEAINSKEPDALLYHDSFGSWGRQQFIISSSTK